MLPSYERAGREEGGREAGGSWRSIESVMLDLKAGGLWATHESYEGCGVLGA